MRKMILAAAALAAMGGAAWGQAIATIDQDGRLTADWQRMRECAAADPGPFPEVKADVGTPEWAEQYKAAQRWELASRQRWDCTLAMAARLDGWRAAGGAGEPPR